MRARTKIGGRRAFPFGAAACVAAAAALLAAAAPAPAQEGDADTVAATDTAADAAADTMEYRREVFAYPGQDRRDPFRPLQTFASTGPRLDELDLSGILYQEGGGSVVILADPSTSARYRLRVGDTVGFARLARVEPRRAVFTVQGFGRDRNVVLRLDQDEESSR